MSVLTGEYFVPQIAQITRIRSANGRWRKTSFDYSHIVYIKRSSSSYASF